MNDLSNHLKNSLDNYEFDHVGIAVESISEGSSLYRALGYEVGEIEEIPSESVRVAMFELKNNSRIELLEPIGDKGPITKFLNKRGAGIHHICLRVKELDNLISHLKTINIRLVNENPRLGAGGCRIVFVHPSSNNGVLLELSEVPS